MPINGSCGNPVDQIITRGVGGGYLVDMKNSEYNNPNNGQYVNAYYGTLGGGEGFGGFYRWVGGPGGVAGWGGNVKVSKNAEIKAYNGNSCTLEKNDPSYINSPVEIWAQKGILLEITSTLCHWDDNLNIKYTNALGFKVDLKQIPNPTGSTEEHAPNGEDYRVVIRNSATCETTSYGQGIGSGAGYIELYNGTYTIDSNLN